MLVFLGDIFMINLNLKQMIRDFLQKKPSCSIGYIKDNNINNEKNFTIEYEKNNDVIKLLKNQENLDKPQRHWSIHF